MTYHLLYIVKPSLLIIHTYYEDCIHLTEIDPCISETLPVIILYVTVGNCILTSIINNDNVIIIFLSYYIIVTTITY